MQNTVTDLIYGALTEIRVARGGDVVRAEDQALCLQLLNEVLERLAVTPNAVYARVPGGGPLTPGISTYQIGPTGTFITPRRPTRIPQAVLHFAGGTAQPLTERSLEWCSAQALPASAGIPQFFGYNPAWPNGSLVLAPVPTQPDVLALVLWTEIAAVADTDTIDLPPGYSELLRLWTAKKAAPSFAREFSGASQQALLECLADVFGANIGRVNDADTRDGGVPGGRGGVYDYRTGEVY